MTEATWQILKTRIKFYENTEFRNKIFIKERLRK